MEALITEFTDQALQGKDLDPSTIQDLMKLFELEAYKAWAAMELENQKEVEEAEKSMKEAEDYLDSAMEEFRRCEEELDRTSKAQLSGLAQVAETARKMGKTLEKAATSASKKYIDAAMNSANASMKSAMRAVSSNSNNKVHPSC